MTAQPLLSPLPSSLALQHVQRPAKVLVGGSTLGRLRTERYKSPWQTMLEQSGGSNPLELSTSGRESPLFHLYSLSFDTEQDNRMRQQQEFYLNYGRALRVLREDIPRCASVRDTAALFVTSPASTYMTEPGRGGADNCGDPASRIFKSRTQNARQRWSQVLQGGA